MVLMAVLVNFLFALVLETFESFQLLTVALPFLNLFSYFFLQVSNSAHFTNRVHVVMVHDADLHTVMNQLQALRDMVITMNEDEALDVVVSRLEVVHVEEERIVGTGKIGIYHYTNSNSNT